MRDRTISGEIEIDGYGTCSNCKAQRTYYYWCSTCEFRRYQQAFPTWTSGNKQLDRVILEIQRNAPSIFSFIEWIPYARFSDIKKIGQGAFSTVYTAIWKEGPRDGPPSFDSKTTNRSLPMWERQSGIHVALKHLNDSQNIQPEFFNEIKTLYKCAPDGEDFENFSLRHILRCYGISQNPQTGEYIMVMQYADQGDLEKCLTRNQSGDRPWSNRLKSLKQLAAGLSVIHAAGLTHRNLHAGNVLQDGKDGKSLYIGDVGLSRPIDPPRSPSKGVYGVMPYVAPEVLLGGSYTQAADIYSFGILAWELMTDQRPFIDRAHDPHLHLDIYNGLRPEIGQHIPSPLTELIKSCWDPDPSHRPTADKLEGLLTVQSKVESPRRVQTPRNFDDMLDYFNEKKDSKSHPEAIYTTRFLKFIDPTHSTSFGTDTQGVDDAKSFIFHKIKEIKKYQHDKGCDIRQWKDQDFRILVDWYYWTGR